MQLHIENVNIHLPQRQQTMASALLDALVRKAMEDGDEGQPADAEIDRKPSGVTPKIGEYWIGQGGIYAGMCRGRDGDPDYHLILCKDAPEQGFKWQAALDHAKTIEADGHQDITVPTRWESPILYANLQDQFDTDYWYWTSTQSSESGAWYQRFFSGSQGTSLKVYERRVRFVRRLAI